MVPKGRVRCWMGTSAEEEHRAAEPGNGTQVYEDTTVLHPITLLAVLLQPVSNLLLYRCSKSQLRGADTIARGPEGSRADTREPGNGYFRSRSIREKQIV